jgi:hypothetical protein
VLEGSADDVRLNGIDRRIGGCHLTGAEDWRYDERLETARKPERRSRTASRVFGAQARRCCRLLLRCSVAQL